MNHKRSCFQATMLAVGLMLLLTGALMAEETETESIHWAYGSILGTGWYKLDGDRQVYVLRIPPHWYYSDSSIDESGQRTLGVEFHFPVTFGLHELEDIGDFVDFENIGTLSFTPGVEIEYPISRRWHLRAYGHLGWGTEKDTDGSALIYNSGLKSRFSFQKGQLDWGIVNEVFFAGYDEANGGSDNLNGVLAGLDFSYPIALRSGTGLNLNWDISYRWYKNDLSFLRTASEPISIEDEWEIGVAIGRQDGPIKIWFMDFEHLGLVYRFNSDGSFRAITINFHSPFTR